MEFGGVVPDPLDRVLYCYWLKRVALNPLASHAQPYSKSMGRCARPLRNEYDFVWVTQDVVDIFHQQI